MVNTAVNQLIAYALQTNLITPQDKIWATNEILSQLKLSAFSEETVTQLPALHEILNTLLDDVYHRGLLPDNSTTYRDLFDTALMGVLTPRPNQIIETFWSFYKQSPAKATDYFYKLSGDTNYIRRDRIAKDMQWQTNTPYGALDITINLSKPEKDPHAIAAAKNLPQSGYPKCSLCPENEGYAGRIDAPARQNHRIIPITINQSQWFLQYSPYVYYNEHCIALNRDHVPMEINRACFEKLLDFISIFPHYFVGSNADLPIVGGSILSHDHFQGGRYTFAMEKAPIEVPFSFPDFPDIAAGIVRWPMSVLRIRSHDKTRLVALADKILSAWREYTDESAFIFATTGDTPHNTITPIARRRGNDFELDLVLRNNITTDEHPLGVYHPHAQLHHIKKENIGLIEVMGLAVLPARLKDELSALAAALVTGKDLLKNPLTEKHAAWAAEFSTRHNITAENAFSIVQEETGLIFSQVLEHAGVFARSEIGRAHFLAFLNSI